MTPNRGRIISEAEFRRMWLDRSLRLSDIGAQLGISQAAVGRRAARRGFPPRARTGCAFAPVLRDKAALIEMWNARVLVAEIARHFGASRQGVSTACKRLGLPPRNRAELITLEQFRQARRDAEAAPCH